MARAAKKKAMKMTATGKRRRWLLVLIPLALIGLLLFHSLRGGGRVTIRNTGATPIHSVVLHVTGAEYPLGDIASGSSAEATVRPRGKSHLEIEFTDSEGKKQRLNAGGDLESGYRGSIQVSIKDGAVVDIEHKITP